MCTRCSPTCAKGSSSRGATTRRTRETLIPVPGRFAHDHCVSTQPRTTSHRRSSPRRPRRPSPIVVAAVLAAATVVPVGAAAVTSGAARPTVGGCPVFPADNPWNRTVTDLAVRPESAAWMASATATARPSASRLRVRPLVGDPLHRRGRQAGGGDRDLRRVARRERQGEVPAPAQRRHRGRRRPARGGRPAGHVPAVRALRRAARGQQVGGGSGAVFDLRSNALRRRAGRPPTPQAFRSSPGSSATTRSPPGPSATRCASRSRRRRRVSSLRRATTRAVRIRRCHRWGAPASARRLRPVTVRRPARVILEALRTYGMIVADNGSAFFISGAPDPRWNDDDLAS